MRLLPYCVHLVSMLESRRAESKRKRGRPFSKVAAGVYLIVGSSPVEAVVGRFVGVQYPATLVEDKTTASLHPFDRQTCWVVVANGLEHNQNWRCVRIVVVD